MKILYLRTWDDDSYLPNFERLPSLIGHKLVSTSTIQKNPATVAAAVQKHGCDAIICSQQAFLRELLHDLPDFQPYIMGNGQEKHYALDDYAGSIIWTRERKDAHGNVVFRSVPCLIINPLQRLVTVPYEKFLLDRYVSKLTKPHKWWKQTRFQWRMVTESNAEATLERLEQARLIGIDIETPDGELQNPWKIISCVSYTAYFPNTNTTESYVIPFTEAWHYRWIRRANATLPPKVFQNGSYDNVYFLRWNCPVHNWLHDTQHLFHSWYSELPKRLDFLASFAIRDVRFWKDDGKSGNLDDLYRYCAYDSWATVNAYLALLAEVPDWAVANYYQEFPLVFPGITAAMEGLDIDVPRFMQIATEQEKAVHASRQQITKWLGCGTYIPGDKKNPGFNPNSSQQVTKLFELLGCGHLEGTGKAQMMKAKAAHPVNDFILSKVTEYREAAKELTNYFVEEKLWNGRLYYSFDPSGTDTSRLASKESAFWCGFQIQNVPGGDTVKSCIRAPEGWFLAEADKEQAEARCVGYLSGEESLIALVESSHDYHSWNASQFFGVPYESIYDEANRKVLDKELRDLSKRTNHGANYNMGPAVMLDTMGPKKVAQAKRVLKLPAHWSLTRVCEFLLEKYSATYPKVKRDWYRHIINEIAITKKLVSPLGWTRYFFSDPSKSKPALNAAVAHGPQNLNVAILNREWYKIWRETIYGSLRGRVRIKAQIHDSLLFIYRKLEDAHAVLAMMSTAVPVKGADGVVRTMLIPTALSTGKGGKLATRWSELK